MLKILSSTKEHLLDLLFPIHCLGCGKNREDLPAEERWICPECLTDIMPREEQICPNCKEASEGGRTHDLCRRGFFLDGLWAGAYYDELLERAVHDFKFKFMKDLAYPLSQLMIRSIFEVSEYGDFQDLVLSNHSKEQEDGVYLDEQKNARAEAVLMPVPLHRKRYAERGFNQSMLLAGRIGKRFSLPVRDDLLLRIKNTKPQSQTQGKEERWKNIKSAFSCPSFTEVKGKNIILVDDVCTTSATLDECAKELKRGGAKSVWGLVAVRK